MTRAGAAPAPAKGDAVVASSQRVLQFAKKSGGAGLHPLVLQAVQAHRAVFE